VIFCLDLLEFHFDHPINFGGLFAQMTEFAEGLHPRLSRGLCIGSQLLFDGFNGCTASRSWSAYFAGRRCSFTFQTQRLNAQRANALVMSYEPSDFRVRVTSERHWNCSIDA
jgi:hypothetical protein